MEIVRHETGAILDTKPVEITGRTYFEERLIPHRLFQGFAFVRPSRKGVLALLGCVRGGWQDPEAKRCRAYPGGPNAFVVASLFHPMESLPRVLRDFQAGALDRHSRRAWKSFNRARDAIFAHFGVMVPR